MSSISTEQSKSGREETDLQQYHAVTLLTIIHILERKNKKYVRKQNYENTKLGKTLHFFLETKR